MVPAAAAVGEELPVITLSPALEALTAVEMRLPNRLDAILCIFIVAPDVSFVVGGDSLCSATRYLKDAPPKAVEPGEMFVLRLFCSLIVALLLVVPVADFADAFIFAAAEMAANENPDSFGIPLV